MKKLLMIVLFSTLVCSCSNAQKEANYYFIKGLNEYQRENKINALENYEKAYKLDKNNIKILKELAFLYADLGNLEKAQEFYEKVLKINNFDENALENLLMILFGKASQEQVNIEKIEKYSEKIINKKSLLYNYSCLKIAMYKKDYLSANTFLVKVLEDENSLKYKEDFYSMYLEILENSNQKNESYSKVKIFSKLYPRYTEDKNFIIDYVKILDRKQAEDVLLRAVVDIEDNRELLEKLAKIYYESGNIRKYKEVMAILK